MYRNFLEDKYILPIILLGLIVFFASMVTMPSLHAKEVYVNANAPSGGDGTQTKPYQTIQSAVTSATDYINTVHLAAGNYRTANDRGITIKHNMNIVGQSKTNTIINAQRQNRIFTINPGYTVTLTKLTLTGGKAPDGPATGGSGQSGGAIINQGTLTANDCRITDNQAGNSQKNGYGGHGGGIVNDGILNVKNSEISQNYAGNGNGAGYFGGSGGGIGNSGNVNIAQSIITNNHAGTGGEVDSIGIAGNGGDGGGIFNTDGSLTVTKSEMSYNYAGNGGYAFKGTPGKGGNGGGIYSFNGIINVMSSLIVNNHAGKGGKNMAGTSGNAGIGGGFIVFHDPSTISNVHLNSIKENTPDDIIWGAGAAVDARYNWWGSNSSPAGRVSPTKVLYDHWLVLKVTANPTLIKKGVTSKIIANLYYDSNGGYHNPASGYVPDGLPVMFSATLGTINSPVFLTGGTATTTLNSGSISGIANIFTSLDKQIVKNSVKIDTIPPKVKSTVPVNKKTGYSRTASILIKFTENIKTSTYYNSIKIKNLATNKYVTITKAISGNTLYLRTPRTKYTWYQIFIPARAIRDQAGNNLAAAYSFRFKTGA